jgi:hypothetical protein
LKKQTHFIEEKKHKNKNKKNKKISFGIKWIYLFKSGGESRSSASPQSLPVFS